MYFYKYTPFTESLSSLLYTEASIFNTYTFNGNWPHDFNITPDGEYLVCAHEKSHNLVLFKINGDGTTSRLDSEIEVPEGIFVGFI